MDVNDLYRTDDSGSSYWTSLITIISSGSLLSAVASKQTSSSSIIDLLRRVHWVTYEEIVSLLVKNGLDVNHMDSSGSFALKIASADGNTELAELLLKFRAKVNLQDKEGVSSLMEASSRGSMCMVRLLARYRASIDLQDKKGWPALMFAVTYGHVEIILYLLERGAQINLQDINGTSLLMLSCFSGDLWVTKILLAHDAIVNLQNKERITALMMSSYNGHTLIAELLLMKYEADIDIRTDIGRTALNFSEEMNHQEVTKLLTKYGARARDGRILGKRSHMLDPTIISAVYTSPSAQAEARELEVIKRILRALSPGDSSDPTLLPYELDVSPELRDAYRVLFPLAYKWEDIGALLKFGSHSLKEIKYNCDGVAITCLREMLHKWLKRAFPAPTWGELKEVVEHVTYGDRPHKSART